jgi:phospholipid/cholesterol/gamma-HCH transport system permease protein
VESSAETSGSSLAVERVERGGAPVLRFTGALTFRELTARWAEVRRLACADEHSPLAFDLSGVDTLDANATALVAQLARECGAQVSGARGEIAELYELYGGNALVRTLAPPPRPAGLLDQIGRATIAYVHGLRDILDYVGDSALAFAATLRRPRSLRWRDVSRLMEQAGADGLPIVLLIDLLIGLVVGFQAALQLRQFGANIYVANLVSLSITRELGPLMTAIVVAGRSGAAYASSLGTMRVSEEIDALLTLGLDPYRFLVFPRVLALVLVVPMLTLLGDIAGILGGMLVAVGSLDLTPDVYFAQTRKVLETWDVVSGLLKSAFFAFVIASVACQRGLQTSGGAEGVGRSTTSAVVATLFFLVAADAVFTWLFDALGV